MKQKKYFPLFIDLEEKPIVVIGGGTIATRRVRTLLQFTRGIHVVAPQMTPELQKLGEAGVIRLSFRSCRRADLQNVFMVLAATNDRKVDDDIYRICKEEGIYVNIASDREKCDFHFPGIIVHDELTVGINAGGVNHGKAKLVRKELQKYLEDEF